MKLKYNYVVIVIIAMVMLKPAAIIAQELALKASFGGIPVQGFAVEVGGLDCSNLLDFNRDGVPDRPFIDSKNERLVILSGSDNEKWIVPLQYNYYKVEFEGTIAGFYEMDGDVATTEVVIAKRKGNRFWSPVILSVNRASSELQEDGLLSQPNYFLLGINDVDQDGKEDIIVADTTAKMIDILSY